MENFPGPFSKGLVNAAQALKNRIMLIKCFFNNLICSSVGFIIHQKMIVCYTQSKTKVIVSLCHAMNQILLIFVHTYNTQSE